MKIYFSTSNNRYNQISQSKFYVGPAGFKLDDYIFWIYALAVLISLGLIPRSLLR